MKYQKEFDFNLIREGKFDDLGNKATIDRVSKQYLIHLYGSDCMKCGWNEKNVITEKVPIELEHIDGNSENNLLENLKLLCPNCHSLTPTYKSLNNGNGRYKRRKRYQEGKSY
jgi:5-methylcytosine-specific restriction endonuclease McrA